MREACEAKPSKARSARRRTSEGGRQLDGDVADGVVEAAV